MKFFRTCLVVGAVVLSASALFAGPTVFGQYVEARSCDVWTGPCFSNSEINTAGELAVFGWTVRQGSWDGVEIGGLGLAVAVRAEGTLTTPREGKVRSVIYLDEKASEEAGRALISMARNLAGKYLENVVDVRRVKLSFESAGEETILTVGEVARVRTSAFDHCKDKHCGNEEVAYPALSRADHVSCAKALEHSYSGPGLQARWSDPMKRSAMVGHFSL